MIELVVGLLALALAWLLAWAFRELPAEKWQFVASIPLHRHEDGHWTGLNLTFYGLLTALGYMVAIAFMIVMCASVQVALSPLIGLIAVLLIALVPSSRWVAVLVEGKQHTFTVAGAVFVASLICPVAVLLCNRGLEYFGANPMPTLPILAAMAISYTFGEGIGRIACISFGCCYGKPVSETSGIWRLLFTRLHFVFEGSTKKIAYEGNLHGVPVIPIQAITSALYVVSAVAGFWIFMYGWYTTALISTLAISQLWRLYSELLRADFRGGKTISPYQWMAIATLLIGIAYGLYFRGSYHNLPDLERGLSSIWAPGPLMLLQLIGFTIFFYTGRSEVTESQMQIRVCHERI